MLLNIHTIRGKHKTAFVNLSDTLLLAEATFTANMRSAMSGVDLATSKPISLDSINAIKPQLISL